MKTKIKFTDIAGMLERDEMREITGGCGQTYGSAMGWGGGSGGSSFGSIMGMGFGGGASYGGSSASSSSSSSGSSYSSNSYSSNSYSNGWSNTANGLTTNDPKAISRYFDFVYANGGVVNSTQTNVFIKNEATAAGQQANNIQLYGTVLNNVTVINNYHGPSTIPKGIVINNGIAKISDNSFGGATGSANSNPNWFGMPIHGSAVKPSVLEAALMSKAVYGDKVELEGKWNVSEAATGLVYNDPASGFKSQLYERTVDGKKQYCYVTAGTEKQVGDIAADILQLGGISLQYKESVDNAKALKKLFGDALSFAGHSMGGGMAEANARATGESATTFNAAGLSVPTALLLGLGVVSDTNAYIMNSDPLNAIQLANPYLTTAGGEKHFLSAASSSGAMTAHSIDSMIASLREFKTN
jgi:hypothetical protein